MWVGTGQEERPLEYDTFNYDLFETEYKMLKIKSYSFIELLSRYSVKVRERAGERPSSPWVASNSSLS